MNPTYPTGNPVDPGMVDALDEGIEAAGNTKTEEELERERQEEAEVKACWAEYEKAYKFDKSARAQYAIDRRYAAGTANVNWAVEANLIGSFIDILVSFLYARNPDVSVKKAPRVHTSGTRDEDNLAKTLEIVVSSLMRAPTTRLKKAAKRWVRAGLTTGVGWLKVILVSNGTNIPQMTNELNDSRRNIADLEASLAKAQDPAYQSEKSEDEIRAELHKQQLLQDSLQQKMEVALRKSLVVDFVSSEDMQVALDVRAVTDYVSAGWVANAIYRPMTRICSMFPRITKDDLAKATVYHQRKNKKDLEPLAEQIALAGFDDGSYDATKADQYIESGDKTGNVGEDGIEYGKIVEMWDRDTGHVKTMIDGIHKWAREPYQPDYPTSRFYPYYLVAFYEVDGERHPQSLPIRLRKLQDEYASVRSSQRLTRQRSIPATMFDAGNISPEDAKSIERSVHQEFIPIRPVNSEKSLRESFSEKPIASVDMRLYDTSSITSDMERISGVQEALQQTVATPKTATEAQIQQSGFASRTTSDRDVLETEMTEMAQAIAEMALQALDPRDVQRRAGASAFWPHGMEIDDLLTMVEIEIEAGTTGKPREMGDKEAWGVVLPVLKEMQMVIDQVQAAGNMPLAEAMKELLRETMVRMGDDIDVDRFIPAAPMMPPAVPGMMGAPGMPGAPGTPPLPTAGAPGAGTPPPGDPTALVPPEMMPGQMPAPM